jgi:hypothetical protein
MPIGNYFLQTGDFVMVFNQLMENNPKMSLYSIGLGVLFSCDEG